MTTIESFKTDKKFLARQHFPYGLTRSGEFTTNQVRLLEAHGYAYEALSQGTREPVTADEEQFLAFCHGDKPAESAHEKVWQKYTQITSTPKIFRALGAIADTSDYSSDSIDVDD